MITQFSGDQTDSEDFEEPELVIFEIEEEPLTAWDQSYKKLCRGEGQVPIRQFKDNPILCYKRIPAAFYLFVVTILTA